MIKIVVVGLDGCLGSAFLGLLDFFALARQAITDAAPRPGETSDGASDISVVAASATGGPIRDGKGASFEVDASFAELAACEAAIVPSFSEAGESRDSFAIAEAAAWLRRHYTRGAIIGGGGSGIFALGEAGLLDGRRCAATWRRSEEIRRRYPKADVAGGARLIEDRRIVTRTGPFFTTGSTCRRFSTPRTG
jgi:transcriptional regulator GlxA family with amidase domain